MIVQFSSIEWDSDNTDLPTTVFAELNIDFDIEQCGADYLSNKYGNCVISFCFKVTKV